MTRQNGFTIMGFLSWAIVGIFVALLGFKVLPVYLEYFSVQKALAGIARDLDLQTATPQEIRSAFTKHAMIDNINVISGNDLEIGKEGNDMVARATYSQKVPLVGNINVCIDFDTSTAKR
jgi:hypothetical protein